MLTGFKETCDTLASQITLFKLLVVGHELPLSFLAFQHIVGASCLVCRLLLLLHLLQVLLLANALPANRLLRRVNCTGRV